MFHFDLLQWLVDRLTELLLVLSSPIHPFIDLIGTTPLHFTTQNAIVHHAWAVMVGAADLSLGLVLVVGTIQIMYGQSVGALRMPIGQFVAKVLFTALLIHLSAFIGEQLLLLNNLLCEAVRGNVQDFILKVNDGQLFSNGQLLIVAIVLVILFCITFFRIIFQCIKRVVRFNLLFILSGPALLTSAHPYTASVCSMWARMYIATIFEQFLQFLTFGLGFQFLIATKQTGLTGLLLATAMLSMTAEIPGLLSRFTAVTGGNAREGIGALAGTAVKAVTLLV
ncbi:hypothetical protein EI42_04414 [Thermosporothrix hazakensis]|jgi:hypothetical protein|uniref:TrbL/VirB6 plasmid conjugal transfer protein n=2 Tax=Thermosporothrix TaxID=768650 RepID=A0A326U5R5_THEHA|nr:hypothetical protein [Thermosporothrix hazakensis]PZW25362.1 hypothetical protein EI42_04414 [Thermosporothrix hazakensis]BBH87205.1 hypothetical protein KTC_19560 [Thermosporothrix sp. COM3]GCE50594.1 hypothetical protein KTH_54630 [Thermosporothrix hazakensis]